MIIDFKSNALFDCDEYDPYEYHQTIKGSVTGYLEDDSYDETEIARFECTYFEVNRAMEYLHPQDFFDLSHAGLVIYNAIYQQSENGQLHFNEATLTALNRVYRATEPLTAFSASSIFGLDLLLINKIEIISEARGSRLAAEVIRQIAKNCIRDAAFIALIPAPTKSGGDADWDAKMDFSLFQPDRDLAVTALAKYYESMGFQYIDNSTMIQIEGGRLRV